MTLKDRKEAFVTGLSGGSTADIYLVSSVSAVSYLIWCILKKRTHIFTHPGDLFAQLLDFLLNWNNLLLAVTLYSDNIVLLVVLNLVPIVFVLFKNVTPVKTATITPAKTIRINLSTLKPRQYLPFKPYITIYRAQMMILTCICILAVDFPLFPRRFAKVETWGTSMMDLGVGSFAFSMGVITARSFLRQHLMGTYSYPRNIVKAVKGSLPILALGVFRLLSVKFLDYQEHVTEYGKYWNFFFTLGCLPLLTNLLSPLIFLLSPLLLSALIGIIYEVLLRKQGLIEYIVSAPRVDFLSDNREGIFSLIGYFCICLNGLALGSMILTVIPAPHNLVKLTNSLEDLKSAHKSKTKPFLTFTPLQGLAILSVLFHATYVGLYAFYDRGVSRRMTNFPYVVWVSAYNASFLFGYKLIENLVWGEVPVKFTTKKNASLEASIRAFQSRTVPVSLTAVNNNSLVLFLVANVFTGLVNMNFDTLDSSVWAGMLVLMGYELVLAAFTMVLYQKGIVLR